MEGRPWEEVLRAQQEELRRLEQMNEELDAGHGNLDADITKALRKSSLKHTPRSAGSSRSAKTPTNNPPKYMSEEDFIVDNNIDGDHTDYNPTDIEIPSGRQSGATGIRDAHVLDSPEIDASKAPETAAK
jgi:hypothetical protein